MNSLANLIGGPVVRVVTRTKLNNPSTGLGAVIKTGQLMSAMVTVVQLSR